MKSTHPIIWLITGLMLVNTSRSQEYIQVNQKEHIYDIDVIVFARRLSQPSAEVFNNAPMVAMDEVRVLEPWDQEMPLVIYPEPVATEPSDESEEQWQVPIEEQAPVADVLSWVMLEKDMSHPIINRLEVNPGFKPLLHQKWRQPATPFLSPEYVSLSQFEIQSINEQDVNINLNNLNDLFSHESLYTDFSLNGQVAFSKQRFIHLHVNLNLFRINAEGEQIIHNITQQKRVELGEWQYFDHQQFGLLAKVTAVEIKPPGETEE